MLDKTSRAADRIVAGAQGKTKTFFGIDTVEHLGPEKITARLNQKIRNEKDQDQETMKELYA